MYKHLILPDSKHRSYRGRYRVGDNPKIHEVTLHTTVKEVAQKLLNEIHEDAQRESVGLVPAVHTRKALRRPIGELFAEYLANVEKNGRTSEHIRLIKLRFLAVAEACSWRCMSDVKARTFIDWRNAQTKYQTRTLNNFFDAARAFFNWVDRNYEIPNPLSRVESLEVPVKYPQGPRAFTENELQGLFAVAKPRRRFFYRVMAFSGLRRIEAKRLLWGDVILDDAPRFQLRAEATKARRADVLPILSTLADELRAARPENWKPNMLVFPRGVADVETLRRDMQLAGVPLLDSLERPAGIHTFRRTFISQLQKAEVHSRVIAQLARHKSLRMTDWKYTDTTLLPLSAGMEKLSHLAASPRISPRFSSQNGVLESKPVQTKSREAKTSEPEVVDSEEDHPALATAVQSCLNLAMVPRVGIEPTRISPEDFESTASANSATWAQVRGGKRRHRTGLVNPKLAPAPRTHQISSPRSNTPCTAASQAAASRALSMAPAVANDTNAKPEAKSFARSP